MPISPENRKRYPANWLEIVDRIRRRAGNKCEWCSCPNRTFVVRETTWGDADTSHLETIGRDLKTLLNTLEAEAVQS